MSEDTYKCKYIVVADKVMVQELHGQTMRETIREAHGPMSEAEVLDIVDTLKNVEVYQTTKVELKRTLSLHRPAVR